MHYSIPAGSNINRPGFDTMFSGVQVEAKYVQMMYSVGFNQKELYSHSYVFYEKIPRLSQLISELDPPAKYSTSENLTIVSRTSFQHFIPKLM